MQYESTDQRELTKAIIDAKLEGKLGGICLTNTDPEADYKAIVEKNRKILEDHGLSVLYSIYTREDGQRIPMLELRHIKSGQYQKSAIPISVQDENSPDGYVLKRIIYEGLLGIASSNDAIDADLFGPKRNHRKQIPLYDKTADYVEFEFFDQTGKKHISRQDRREYEKRFLGMTTEEEAVTKFEEPVRRELSWTDINGFTHCKRCFFNAKKLGIKQPNQDPESFKLPKLIDELLKKEFDQYRKQGKAHPIMPKGLKPLRHHKLKKWQTGWSEERKKKEGIQFDNVWENWLASGGVDDLWINDKKELVIVEYKATVFPVIYPEGQNIPSLKEHKRQIEFYSWLFKKNNFTVCPTGYLIFCNAITTKDALDRNIELNLAGPDLLDWNIEFEPHVLAHKIDDSWVQETINQALESLQGDTQPKASPYCKTCKYFDSLYTKLKQQEPNS